jgi:hypothetical protein
MSTIWPDLVRHAYKLGIWAIVLVLLTWFPLGVISIFRDVDDLAKTVEPIARVLALFFFLCTAVLWIEAWRLTLREASERHGSLDLLWTAALIFLAVPMAWYVCYRARRADVV